MNRARTVKKVPQAKSMGEATLALQLRAAGIAFISDRFKVPGSRFRWDFAVGDRLLVEVDGGWGWRKKALKVNGTTYIPISAHNSRKGVERDHRKSHEAVMAGFVPLRFTSHQVLSGYALKTIERALEVLA